MRSCSTYLTAGVLSVVTAGPAAAGSLAFAAAVPASVAPATGAAAAEPMQEVVVEGRHEGPRMWIVRRGDHTPRGAIVVDELADAGLLLEPKIRSRQRRASTRQRSPIRLKFITVGF